MSHLSGVLPWFVAAWLFFIGLYGVVTSRHLVHLVICLAITQASTYVLLIAIGFRTGAGAPIFADRPPQQGAVDPIVQALVMTDVVVEATVFALLLALALQVHARARTFDPGKIRELRG